MKHIFIVGSKGIPASYGGFETFADRLTAGKKSEELSYHVACLDKENRIETVNGAECFHLAVPNIGPAKAVLYDRKAFLFALKEIRDKGYQHAVILVLALRIGPFFRSLVKKAHLLGATVAVNPDGHEFLRAKWNSAIKKYWKYSEGKMVEYADLCICDAKEMERYIKEEYKAFSPKTIYLSYGADILGKERTEPSKEYSEWLLKNGLSAGKYALTVGRFVPENNYETMIREYMSSKAAMPFVLITDTGNRFYQSLRQTLAFEKDDRIRFVGTVYDRLLLSEIRKGAAFYIHGHEVGGTNPTLLEALASTEVNLLIDVPFSREVGEDAVFYWKKENPGELSELIYSASKLGTLQRQVWGQRARHRIRDDYSWEELIPRFEKLFLSLGEES